MRRLSRRRWWFANQANRQLIKSPIFLAERLEARRLLSGAVNLLATVTDMPAVAPQTILPASAFVQQTKLIASDGAEGDEFGGSTAISGNTMVIGAGQAKIGNNSYQGAAYVFTEVGSVWTQVAKLTASDGKQYDGYGLSVAISGNTVLMGAPHAGGAPGVTNPGKAYVFVEPATGWANMTQTAQFGSYGFSSVAISGNTLLVGVP